MSQHDMEIGNQQFPNSRSDINAALQALASTSIGNSRPATVFTGQIWIDNNTPSSTIWTMYIYDGTTDVPIALIDSTNHVSIPLLNPYAPTVGGTANAITLSVAPAIPAYYAGVIYTFIAGGTNTGAVTVNIDSVGVKDITKFGTTALTGGEIQSGQLCIIQYDGTRFQLLNPFTATIPVYSTGSWTPVPAGSSTPGSPTGTFEGTYTRIGNRADISGRLTFTSLGGMAGSFQLGGLPFTALSGQTGYCTINANFRNNYTNDFAICAQTEQGTSRLDFLRMDVDNTTLAITDMSNTSTIYFSGTYFI